MKNAKRIVSLFFVIITVFLCLPLNVSAASSIDATDVMFDLEEMNIDLSAYKKDTSDDKGAKLMYFLEYGYGANNNQSDYGLYLYVYNPTCEEILTSSPYNTVQLSGVSADGSYSRKYKLLFLSKSSDASGEDRKNLYYKFKVDIDSDFLAQAKFDNHRRIYKLVDLELQYSGELNPRLTRIENEYTCTGFQPYHNADRSEVSNHSTTWCNLETIRVELHPASWKTDTSDKGASYQYEVSSVYFNIPNHYLEKYGNMEDEKFRGLESVHMEWYEYKINGLVTDNDYLYQYATDAIGHKIVTETPFTTNIRDHSVPFGFYMDDPLYDTVSDKYRFAYNYYDYDSNYTHEYRFLHRLHNSFKYSGSYFEEIGTKELMEGIYRREDGAIQAYFAVDDGRQLGHNDYTITVTDKILSSQLASYASNHNDFITWLSGRGKLNKGEYSYPTVNCIEMITEDDFDALKDPSVQADALFISEGDLSPLKDFYTDMGKDNQTVYLMRFAVTDYLFSKVLVWQDTKIPRVYDGEHYYFEKTIFQNFDILDFTFKDEGGELTTVPVSSRPITGVGSITPGPNYGPSWWDKMQDNFDYFSQLSSWIKLAILVLGTLIVVLIISKLIPLISAFLRFIGRISDRLFERSSRRLELKYKNDENERAWNRDSRDGDANNRAWNKDRRDDEENDRAWNRDKRDNDANDRAWKEDRRRDDANDRAWRKDRRDEAASRRENARLELSKRADKRAEKESRRRDDANNRAWRKDRRDEAASRREDARLKLSKRADKRSEREDVRRQEKHDIWKNKQERK